MKQSMNTTKTFAVSVPVSARLLVLSVITAAAAIFWASCAKKGASDPIALTVNGQPITVAEVDDAAEYFRQQQSVLSPGLLFEGGGDLRRVAARQLAANILLLDATKRLGWQADPTRVDAAVDRFISQFPDRTIFLSQLAAMGESEESMRKGVEDEFLLDSLLSTVSNAAEPASDEECRAHYDANTKRYTEPDRARASHIVFELLPDATDSQVQAAMTKAKEAQTKAKAGADFNALIKEYSNASGGDLGWFKRGDLVPDLERNVFSMKVGGISDPIPSGMGIHIIKKTDEKAPRQLTYAEAEDEIRGTLTAQKKTKKVSAYVDSLIGTANVKYVDTTLNWAVNTPTTGL